MKITHSLTLLVLVAFISCQTPPSDYVILTGKIEDPNSRTITIQDGLGKDLYSIALDEQNEFKDTLQISSGLYMFYDGKEVKEMFLKPGYDLSISLNAKAFDESIKYTGVGAKENNYLAEKFLLTEGFGALPYTSAALSEDRFLKITDSLTLIKAANFTKHTDFDKDFVFFESNTLHYEKLYFLANYESSHRYSTDNMDFKVSANFPNAFENIVLGNDSLLSVPFYNFYIDSYLGKYMTKKYEENDTLDFMLTSIEIIEEHISNQKLKEKLVYNTSVWALGDTKDLEKTYTKIKSIVENKAYLKEISEMYLTLKKTAKGQPSPPFNFENIDGEMISLASLKGSIVYIDIWATWCGPCIDEIPYLKAISGQFLKQDIKFVSICTSDTKERWEEMVKEKELAGIQLFAPSNKDSFFQSYVLQGIPRFIIIDKEGNIVDANAIRPSNPQLKKLLKELV